MALETFLRDFGPLWHDSITQLQKISMLHLHDVPLDPKGAPSDWDLATVEADFKNSLSRSRSQFKVHELCDLACYPVGISNTQEGCLNCTKGTKVCQPAAAWTTDIKWFQAFCCQYQILTLPSKYAVEMETYQKGNFYPIFCCPFLLTPCKL